jgi:hypothetical protein
LEEFVSGILRTTTVSGRRFYALEDVLLLLIGERHTRRYRLCSPENRSMVSFIDPETIGRRFAAVNAEGVREVCSKFNKRQHTEEILAKAHDPFAHLSDAQKSRIAELHRQRGQIWEVGEMLKGGPAAMTDREVVSLLSDRANDVLDAFYRDKGDAALRQAIQGLQAALGTAAEQGYFITKGTQK